MVELFCSNDMRAKYAQEERTRYERHHPLELQSIAGGVVIPLRLSENNEAEDNEFGGVCTADFQFVPLSLTKRVSPPNFACHFQDWFRGAHPEEANNKIEYLDEDVVFIGALPKHYGHFILEGLARLWFYLEDSNRKYRAVYISGEGEDRFLELIEFFGLNLSDVRKIEQPTKFRTVIVPEQSIRLHDYFHRSYKLTMDRIKMSIEPIRNDKVYFSKQERKNDRAIGEMPFETVLAKNGYAIYFPERMSLRETVAVLKGAKTFVASSGTNSHNAVFLEDGAVSVCLNRSAHFHPAQIMIDRMHGLRAIYIDSFLFASRANWSSGPFLLFPTRQFLAFLASRELTDRVAPLYKHYPTYLARYALRRVRRTLIDILRPIHAAASRSRWSFARGLATFARKYF